MSTPLSGIEGKLSIGGTVIALLHDANLEVTREAAAEYGCGGTYEPQDILRGKLSYKLTAKRAYVDNAYLALVRGTANLVGTFLARGGTTPYLAGTVVLTKSRIAFANEAAASLEDIEGLLYNVSAG